MAKRFTDTQKWADPWFHQLPPKMKMVWCFLCDECDGAGIWKANFPLLSFYIGEPVTEADFREAFSKKTFWLRDELVWIPGFIKFQYQTLSPKNHAHRGIMRKIISVTETLPLDEDTLKLIEAFKCAIRPSFEGHLTPQVKEEEEVKAKVKEKVKEKEEEEVKGGVGEKKFPITSGEVAACLDDWRSTLQHFKIERALGERDQLEIARAVQAFGPEWVKLAFAGARKQKPGKNYDPAQFVSLRLYLDPKRIERLVNIGAGKESAEGIDWSSIFGKAS